MYVTCAAFAYLWACWCNVVLEVTQSGGDVALLVDQTLTERLPTFLLGSGVITLLVIFLWAVSGRLTVAFVLSLCGAIVIGYANHEKLVLRGEPLYPSDLAFVGHGGFLAQMVGGGALALLAAVVVTAGVLVIGVSRVLRRHYPRVRRQAQPRLWAFLVGIRIATVLLVAAAAQTVSGFNHPGNALDRMYAASGARWSLASQAFNYTHNGLVGGLLHNLDVSAMLEPDGYTRSTMQSLAEKYRALAETANAQRSASALSDVNVVLVLSEAFSDPTVIPGVSYAEDPIPATRRLMERTTSGRMLAQLVGGGTANMEFEALTGQSIGSFLPQLSTPYQQLVPQLADYPSAVGWFDHHGHRTVAIHPYDPTFYQRNVVYPRLGFDAFIHEGQLSAERHIDDNPYVSDASAFEEVTRQIDASTEPLFVNLVTMQNHYPMAGLYDDPIPVSGLAGTVLANAEGYGRGLRHSDDAFARFLDRLKASDEKTAVVFYGDHLPAFWNGGLTGASPDAEMLRTPFLLWSNFTSFPHRPLPTLSPTQFLPLLFELAGQSEPPFFALLDELRRELPAFEHGHYVTGAETGTEVATEAALTPRATALLRDYRLVQYDLSVGKRYAADAMFYPGAG